MEEIYQFAQKVVMEASLMFKEYENKPIDFMSKSQLTDVVTELDKGIEAYICDRISKTYPSHKQIGEETFIKGELTDEYTWILDPIDGTANFIHGFPFYAISLGVTFKNELIIGVVYAPMLKQMFRACRGLGAYLNDQPLKISNPVENKSNALVATEWGTYVNMEFCGPKIESMTRLFSLSGSLHGIRSTGCASLNLCYLAYGKLDAYYEWGLHCWDIAAGVLIVEEAGGFVRSVDGSELDIMGRNILASSSKILIEEITQHLAKVQLIRDGE